MNGANGARGGGGSRACSDVSSALPLATGSPTLPYWLPTLAFLAAYTAYELPAAMTRAPSCWPTP
eukprot:921201-Prymnesium_polylepis.1